MKNLSPEMIEKAKSAKSTEELVELSCVEKIELTLAVGMISADEIPSEAVPTQI